MNNLNNLKGLRIYLVIILVGLSFLAYSQSVGWKWLWATRTERPEGDRHPGYRYFYHK